MITDARDRRMVLVKKVTRPRKTVSFSSPPPRTPHLNNHPQDVEPQHVFGPSPSLELTQPKPHLSNALRPLKYEYNVVKNNILHPGRGQRLMEFPGMGGEIKI